MLGKFLKYIEDNRLARKDDRILIAVSGGIDSMVMADLFIRSGYNIGIIHCNFTLRGNESDMDEELVRTLATENNLPFFTKKFNTAAYAEKNGVSIQMAARKLRYEWFEEIRINNGYDYVAVAHNLNDSAETLLINLTRGTGIAGLAGIKPSFKKIIRPLLFATRNSIEEYCSLNNISYREDKSNSETKYARNKIRHRVLPVLKEINPAAEFAISETAERLSLTYKVVNEYIDEIRKKTASVKGNKIFFYANRLKQFIKNDGVLFELFRPYGINSSTLKSLKKIISGDTGKQVFTQTHWLVKDREKILVSEISNQENISYEINNLKELRAIPFIKSVVRKKYSSDYKIPADNLTACIDLEKISFPIIIRKWRYGDFFYPLGMNRKKKLSDYLIDRKLSRQDKEHILVLECNEKIVWIIGERIDNRYRITPETKQVLLIRV